MRSIGAHVEDGTYRKDRHGEERPLAAGELQAPPWIAAKAKKVFDSLKSIVSQKGFNNSEYSICLELLATSISKMQDLRKEVKKHGMTYVDEKGILRINPVQRQLNDAENQVERLLGRFGLTPDTKSKVALTKKDIMADGFAKSNSDSFFK